MSSTGHLQHSRRQFLFGSIVAVVLAVLLVMAASRIRLTSSDGQHAGLLENAENSTFDMRVRYAARHAPSDPSIVVIDIDDESYSALSNKLGRWPWTRRVWASVLDYIAPGHPRAVLLDIIFASCEGGVDLKGQCNDLSVDQRFAQSIARSGNVILGYTFSPGSSELTQSGEQEFRSRLQVLQPEAAEPAAPFVAKVIPPQENSLNVPFPLLAQSAAGLGSLNGSFDFDGAVRRVPLEYIFRGKSYRAAALRTADLATAEVHRSFHLEHSFWRGDFAVRGAQRIPVDASGRMVLLWHSGTNALQRIPLWQVICSAYPQSCDSGVKTYPAEFFRNKIVLLGASAAGANDTRPTPLGSTTPGVLVHATAIDALLHNQVVRPAAAWMLPFLTVALALLGAVFVVWVASSFWSTLAALTTGAAYTGFAFLAMDAWHLWLPLVAPIGALGISYIGANVVRYATVGRDLRRTRGTLDRYISPQLVDYVLNNLETVELGGQRRELTILFSDVRNFTTLTEKSDPGELIQLLNEYLAEMTDVIFKHDGVVDKFIGDGILAYWGAFTPGKNHALLAARASLEMLVRLEALNQRWAAEGRNTIAIGIGLNTGEVIFGNVGSGKKIEFTVIGDPVNLASRLEGLNKEYKTSIIISDTTLERLGSTAQVRPLGAVKVKGKTIETPIFELQSLNEGAAGHHSRRARAGD